jgi:hypothetical protein
MLRDHSGISQIMKSLSAKVLKKLIVGTAEPLLVARIDSADWPVVLTNSAFDAVAGGDQSVGQPLADVIEGMLGRDLAVEVSETVRSRQESTLPVEFRSREYLLSLTPLSDEKDDSEQFYAVYWRTTSGHEAVVGDREAHQALLKAKRHIRDLSRDDPVTGLLNTTAFHEVLAHDWSVASREKNTLALVAFSFENFDEYLHVFGRHATDSCLRRVRKRFVVACVVRAMLPLSSVVTTSSWCYRMRQRKQMYAILQSGLSTPYANSNYIIRARVHRNTSPFRSTSR